MTAGKPLDLKETDLEEIFERSSGPGGQNVNKTSTKVTLVHKPTGAMVTVQDTRSQMQNRQLARKRLTEAIREKQEREAADARGAREKLRRQKSPRPAVVKRKFVESKRRKALKRIQRKVEME